MHIFFSCGNAPGLPTGYGGQGLLAVQGFEKYGCRTTILAWNLTLPTFQPFQEYTTEDVIRMSPQMASILATENAASVNWGAIRWYSNPYTQFPCAIRKADLNRMILQSKADVFVALQDIFMFEPGPFACISAVWMPLHFIPVEHPTILSLSDFDIQLPISGWGAALLYPLQSQGHDTWRHIDVLAHGRDLQVYTPDKQQDNERRLVRQEWGWPEDAIVVLMVASNSEESGRKAFDAQFQGFVRFAKKEPNAWLHVHSEIARAYDLGRLLETFGEFPTRSSWTDKQDSRVRTHREAIIRGRHCSVSSAQRLMNTSEKEMAALYRSADILLAATCSEGCGVPILEAQLCGTPVVTTKATAMWEETHLGISVQPKQYIARMDFNSGWMLPDADGICDALIAISSWTDLDERRQQALPLLRKQYGNETIVQGWCTILEKIETDQLRLGEKRKTYISVLKDYAKRYHILEELEISCKEKEAMFFQHYNSTMIKDYVSNVSQQ